MTTTPHLAELRSIVDLGDAPLEGALLVVGEAGIGKTRLLRDAAAHSGLRSSFVHARPLERTDDLSGLSTVLTALSGRRAVDVGTRFRAPADDPGEAFAATRDLVDLLQGMDLPDTLLLVDDVDRMDPRSQVLLGLLAGRLAHTGLRIVATAREVVAGGPLSGIVRADLSPLSAAALAEEVADDRPEPADSTVRVLTPYCGGNPRLLQEHLAQLDGPQVRGDAWIPLPPRDGASGDLVTRATLETLSVEELRALEVAALGPVSRLDVLTEADPGLRDVVEDLVDRGVLRRRGRHVVFHDARVRARLYWSQPAVARRQGHARLAAAAVGRCEHLAAWHRSFDGDVDGDGVDVDALLRSAAAFVGLGEVTAAVELAERALAWASRVDVHLERVIELCSRLVRHGEVVLAARYSRHVQPGEARVDQVLRLAWFGLVRDLVTSQHLADDEVRALGELYGAQDPDGVARLQVVAAWFRAERWETAEARALLDAGAPVHDGASASVRTQVAITRRALDVVDGCPDPEGATQTGLTVLDGSAPAPLLMQARTHTLAGQHAQARDLLNVVLHYPTMLDPVWTDLARLGALANEISAGQFRRARECAAAWDPDSPWLDVRSSVRLYLQAWVAYSTGRLAEADELLQRAAARASQEGASAVLARVLGLRGTIALLGEEADKAVVLLRQAAGHAARFPSPALVRQSADQVEACVVTGRDEEAEALVDALAAAHAARPSRWGELALTRARALVATGEQSLVAFAEAVALFGPGDSPYERGRTLSAKADREVLLGHAHEGARTRTLAVASFDIAGAMGWADRHPLRPTGSPTRIREQLSDEEWAIVNHVRDGLRNRDIASLLFLSVRTVELRLTRIYRRIGVTSRSQLVAALVREGAAG